MCIWLPLEAATLQVHIDKLLNHTLNTHFLACMRAIADSVRYCRKRSCDVTIYIKVFSFCEPFLCSFL